MAQITTKNSLVDFDMCLAVAQAAIDTVMEDAWEAWKERNFKDTIEIFKIKRDGQIVNSQYGLSVQIDPLQVSLAVPDGKLGQVKVTLPVKSGRVVYYDEATEQKAEHQIANWSISFVTDLDKKPVDLKTLAQIDPATHDTAQTVIRNTGLDEGVFSIEYLFLKLTEVELQLSDNKNIQIPSNVPSSARTKALSCLNMLLQRELGEYILGTVVRRNTKQATPTFALTDFVFNVRANWSAAWASTLEYLGEFSGRGLPPVINEARLKLGDFWVRPEQLDGREANIAGIMAISKGTFLEKYLIPRVREALKTMTWEGGLVGMGLGVSADYRGPEPVLGPLSWTFAEERKPSQENSYGDDILVHRKFVTPQGYSLTLQVHPSTNQIGITGQISTGVHYDGTTWLETHAPDAEHHTEWNYVDGHQDISGSVAMTGNGIGTDFNLEAHLQYKIGDPVVDKNEVGGFANVTEALGSVVKALGILGATPQELIRNAQSQLGTAMQQAVTRALARLDVDFKQQTFIPPGGGVFTFQNPCFSNAGDLVIEVLYRQP